MSEHDQDEHADEVEYLYLTIDNVLDLFADYFGCSAADAADQLRNRDGLASAVDRPRVYAHYQSADIALQAAVLAHGIAEGQVFVDGNKTTALLAMLTFLDKPRQRRGALPHSRCTEIAESLVTATALAISIDSPIYLASHARFAPSDSEETGIRHHRECGRAPIL